MENNQAKPQPTLKELMDKPSVPPVVEVILL